MTTEPAGAVILVIDDLPANRRLMQAILTPHGYASPQGSTLTPVPTTPSLRSHASFSDGVE